MSYPTKLTDKTLPCMYIKQQVFALIQKKEEKRNIYDVEN